MRFRKKCDLDFCEPLGVRAAVCTPDRGFRFIKKNNMEKNISGNEIFFVRIADRENNTLFIDMPEEWLK
ncbi:MAG: hypothetical protein DRP87_02025 [Spirochaetes bacterium]|nr:MAG: hypothetical protein DRP87_02025 [Spirochaetota bacterium]